MNKRIAVLAFAFAALAAWPQSAQAQAVRKVYSAGTAAAGDLTYTLTQLQDALNDALPGETIYVQNAAPFYGLFVLPPKSCPAQNDTCYITLRSGINSTGALAGTFPPDFFRITPDASADLAKFKSTENNQPFLRTAYPSEIGSGCSVAPCVASYWKIKLIEGIPNAPWRANAMIVLGTNNQAGDVPAGNIQNLASEIPHHFIIEQVYFHGDPLRGQHRGLTNAAKHTMVRDSYFADIKSRQETQAVSALNTTGPQAYVNNYMAASGENFMTGGDDPRGQFNATVLASPAPTTTSARLSTCPELVQFQWLTLEVAGAEHFREVKTINASCDITFDALTAPPDQPGDADNAHWSWTFGGLLVEKNHFDKPLSWRDPILPNPPSAPSATPSVSGGACATNTYNYRIVGFMEATNGTGSEPWSAASAPTAAAVTGPNGSVSLTWPALTNAYRYRVYRDSAGVWYDAPTTSFTDVCGAPGTSTDAPTGAPPTDAAVWFVKNTFELKNCDGLSAAGPCIVRGNVISGSWLQGQTGPAVNIKVNNQDGGDSSAVLRNFEVTDNIIKSAARAISMCVYECGGKGGGVMKDAVLRNNLMYDIGPGYGNDISAILFTDGSNAGAPYVRGVSRLTFDHNTVLEDAASTGIFWGDTHTATYDSRMIDPKWTNNIQRRGALGWRGLLEGSLQGEGTTSWNLITTGAGRLAANNVWSDATCANYPDTGTNFCPTEAQLQAHFVNYAGNDFRLAAGSAYNNAGTDGLDLGANIDQIEAFTNIALSGNDSGDTAPTSSSGTGSGAAGALTWSHTHVGNYLRVGVAINDSSRTVSSATFNGLALTKLQHFDNNDDPARATRAEYWYMLAPPTVTANVVVTLTGSAAVSAGAASYRNVSQSAPHGTVATAKGDSALASVTVASAIGELVVDMTTIRTGTTTITAGAGQTTRVSQGSATGFGNVITAMSDKEGAASVPMTWTVTDSTPKVWTATGVSLRPVDANASPSVNAGIDQTTTLPAGVALDGTVSDDGLPNPPQAVTTTWSKVSGPGTVMFGVASAVDTTAAFSAAGAYVLRLSATDSLATTTDDMGVNVLAAPTAGVTVRADRVVFNNTCTLRSGSGTPEGALVGRVCDTYWRTDTGAIYSKTSGTGPTGWSTGGVGGSGTTGTLPKWTSAITLGDSSVSEPSGNLLLAPAGDMLLDPGGNDVLPVNGYDLNVGSVSKKYLTGHFAELWSETLVAAGNLSTIGGRVLVLPTTVLTLDIAPGAVTITTKHNSIVSGDRLYLEADSKIEFMAATSNYSGSPGAYVYSVTRNLDGTGADTWYAGDAVANTGQAGNGFMDLYSTRGVKAGTEIGPTIVGNVRNSGTFNDWTPRWAIGNLNGLYGYSSSIYGAAFGVPTGSWIKIDPTNGIRIGNNTTTKISLDAAGNAAFSGSVTAATGTIGGFSILSQYLLAGSGASKVTLSADGTWAMWAGNDNAPSAPFSVTAAGALVASNATITGAITATSGSFTGNVSASTGNIGGWSITSGAIAYDTGTNATSAGLYPFDLPFYAGATLANRATAPFRVTPAGAVTMTNATITGSVTATGGSIGGCTIGGSAVTCGSVTLNSGGIEITAGSGSPNRYKFSDSSYFMSSSGAATIGASGSVSLVKGSGTLQWDGTALVPSGNQDLGATSLRFGNLFLAGDIHMTPPTTAASDQPVVYSTGNGLLYRKTDGYDGTCGGSSVDQLQIENGIIVGCTGSAPLAVRNRLDYLEAEIARLTAILERKEQK